MNDDFTFRNGAIQKWLIALIVTSSIVTYNFPPAIWLCIIGAILLAIGSISNSARTNQWYSWQIQGSLNWFEGWAASTGAVMIVVPLITIFFRSWLS
jgi:hypothetical protein